MARQTAQAAMASRHPIEGGAGSYIFHLCVCPGLIRSGRPPTRGRPSALSANTGGEPDLFGVNAVRSGASVKIFRSAE
jgi:hypothetical protein